MVSALMLSGEYNNSLDSKNRMIIPAKFRGELGYKCMLTKGLDECLVLYPMQTWAAQEEALAKLPMSDRRAREFRRYIYRYAFECEIDKQGRVLIPQRLKELSGIEKDLVTIGIVDRVEIWAKEKLDSIQNGTELAPEELEAFSERYQV